MRIAPILNAYECGVISDSEALEKLNSLFEKKAITFFQYYNSVNNLLKQIGDSLEKTKKFFS